MGSYIKGDTVTILRGMIPSNTSTANFSITTNSKAQQLATITDSTGAKLTFQGQGERVQIGNADLTKIDLAHDWTLQLQYTDSSGALKSSQIRTGGPYNIGATSFFVVVAENGDDADFNDCVCQLNWK